MRRAHSIFEPFGDGIYATPAIVFAGSVSRFPKPTRVRRPRISSGAARAAAGSTPIRWPSARISALSPGPSAAPIPTKMATSRPHRASSSAGSKTSCSCGAAANSPPSPLTSRSWRQSGGQRPARRQTCRGAHGPAGVCAAAALPRERGGDRARLGLLDRRVRDCAYSMSARFIGAFLQAQLSVSTNSGKSHSFSPMHLSLPAD